jgi:predicted aspartyl protease
MSFLRAAELVVCSALASAPARAQYPSAPIPGEQQRILHTATEFARDYRNRLPDFTCTRTTRHFLADPKNRQWTPQTRIAEELTYYRREEHYQIVAVNDIPKTKVSIWTQTQGWIETHGNFGEMLDYVFDAEAGARFQWKGWDYIGGQRMYSFSYHVPRRDDAGPASARCFSWIVHTSCKTLTYSYHGVLFIDADTLDIRRVTHVPEDLPASFASGTVSVDYGRVSVAGAEYLLPTADTFESETPKKLFRNESTYNNYRKFVAASALKTEVTVPTRVTAPPRPPARRSITSRGSSRLPVTDSDDGLAVPVSINGHPESLVVDTGAGISSIAESKAKTLGMTLEDEHFSILDITGKEVSCRLAIAHEFAAGAFRLRDVEFCALAGEGRPAILGLPVLMAFETLRWTREGTLEIGFPIHREKARSNLYFEEGSLAVEATIDGRRLLMEFDTGNDETFLYPIFADDFPEIAKTAGEKQTYEVEGLGQSAEVQSADLPQLTLTVAGAATHLEDVVSLLEPLASQCPTCSGNAGRDLLRLLLKQARSVTVDFRTMRLMVDR